MSSDNTLFVVKYRESGEVICRTADSREASYHYGHTLAFNPKLKKEDLVIIKTGK